MLQANKAKAMVLVIGLSVIALTLVGFANGAIGDAFGLSFLRGESFLEKPGVHLAPQQILGSHAGSALHGGGKFILTNTLLSSFISSILLIILFVVATSKMRLVPGRIQGLVEMLVEGLLNFIESVAGAPRARSLFPVIATIFLFVMANAWIGLTPIYQSIGFIDQGHMVATLVRPAATDLNMPLALALISFAFIEGLGIRHLGFGYVAKFVRLDNLRKGRIFMGVIDLLVGVLELISEFVRLVSFTFRLFGNMTAGEILLLVSGFLVSFVITIPFYGLELLVGLIQAVIFAGLTLVFATIAMTPHDEEH